MFLFLGVLLKIWNFIWLLIYLSYYFIILYVPIVTRGIQPAMVCNFIIFIEQVLWKNSNTFPYKYIYHYNFQIRFIMKTHAFVRSNAPAVFAYKPHSDMEINLPQFTHFIYYIFAPTFVYKNNYPRYCIMLILQ